MRGYLAFRLINDWLDNTAGLIVPWESFICSSTFLTLVLLPVLYEWIEGKTVARKTVQE